MWLSLCHFVKSRKFKKKENGNATGRRQIPRNGSWYELGYHRPSTLEFEMKGAHVVYAYRGLNTKAFFCYLYQQSGF